MKNLSGPSLSVAALSGVLQVFAFPMAGALPLWRSTFAWLSLLPLLWCVLRDDYHLGRIDVRKAGLLGYASGFCFYLGNCYWIYNTMATYGGLSSLTAAAVLVGFCLYLGLYHAFFAASLSLLQGYLGRQTVLLLVPFVWVTTELARARVTSFPWDLLGLSQVDQPLLCSFAPFAGAYALSFLVAAVNALWLVRLPIKAPRYQVMPVFVTFLGVVSIYGFTMRHGPSQLKVPTEHATLIQENLSVGVEGRNARETMREKLDSFSALSQSPSSSYLDGIPELSTTHVVNGLNGGGGEQQWKTSLVVWPESPADFHTNDAEFQAATSTLARSLNVPLILGSLGVVPDQSLERGGRVYDSAALISRDGTQAGRYDKIHLVPFGEYVPLKSVLFFADRLTAGVGDMDRGSDRSLFRTQGSEGVRAFGVFICYESIFGDEVRQFVRNGAEVLVNISDDGWYGDSGAAWQHLNMVRMRAIENQRWVLRATNTGITASIDPDGRVVAALPRKVRASVNVPFAFEHGITFYTRHGDWFAYGCSAVTFAMLGISFLHRVNYRDA